MKLLLFVILGFFITGCIKVAPVEYSCDYVSYQYYNNSEYDLGELSIDYLLIGIDTSYSDIQINQFISTLSQFDQSYTHSIHSASLYKYKEIPIKFNNSKTCEEITGIIYDLEQSEMISYVHYTMQTDDCNNPIWEPMGSLCVGSYSSAFYVQVIDENDLTDLHQIVSETNTELIQQNQFMPNFFELRATKHSNGDALKMANYFYETELFASSEPDITKYAVEQ